jgi:hypothetical protein
LSATDLTKKSDFDTHPPHAAGFAGLNCKPPL